MFILNVILIPLMMSHAFGQTPTEQAFMKKYLTSDCLKSYSSQSQEIMSLLKEKQKSLGPLIAQLNASIKKQAEKNKWASYLEETGFGLSSAGAGFGVKVYTDKVKLADLKTQNQLYKDEYESVSNQLKNFDLEHNVTAESWDGVKIAMKTDELEIERQFLTDRMAQVSWEGVSASEIAVTEGAISFETRAAIGFTVVGVAALTASAFMSNGQTLSDSLKSDGNTIGFLFPGYVSYMVDKKEPPKDYSAVSEKDKEMGMAELCQIYQQDKIAFFSIADALKNQINHSYNSKKVGIIRATSEIEARGLTSIHTDSTVVKSPVNKMIINNSRVLTPIKAQ